MSGKHRVRWTDEAVAELRRQMNLGKTYAQIGAMLGTSEMAIRTRVYRLGWGSVAMIGFRNRQHLVGRKRSPATVAAITAASRARWADAEWRAKAANVSMSPEGMARHAANTARVNDVRRGFRVPEGLREDYRHLRQVKKFSAREAGEVLGLVSRANETHDQGCRA